ncbi:Structural maintenance of chromosomes protein 5 [Coemansia pectinata]|uniref:Structural maintenance of chromosomes protein 5 n=1 Tax=Coemansia pectinata TaxID=1052879 RepID=A0A9W8GWB3_9FUNG|nr:Structural maintenance of chromosomes protein 5 [Coemansia pectinata]
MPRKGHTKVEQKPRVVDELMDSESESEEPELKISRPLANGNGSAAHSAHKYRAGAIMHISLTNFITYDRIDVSPGPHMNMIIGPNGTGKSSIVCAIALGLGENTSVMKRAKDISEFVKHGHEHGAIEITLATGSGSVKIRREMARQGNKSTWKIDGRGATFAEVQRRTRELRIQVNNLCQFLPQDRVVEFSKMSAQGLLKQTQAAVGREDLQLLQEELVKRRAQERQAMGEAARLRNDTETLRKQNALLERDVQRWQERQTAESQLRVLTALVPLTRYAEVKAAHDAAKQAKNVALAAFLQTRDSTEASELGQQMSELEAQAADREQARRAAGDERLAGEKAVRQQVTRLERLEADHKELQAELEGVRSQAQRRRDQIIALRAEVARLEAACNEDQPPEEENDSSARRAARELRERQLQLTNELVEVGDEQRALMSSGRQISADIERRTAQLRGLDDVAMRQREALRKVHEDSIRALEWLEANRDKFSQHVFAPVCLEASVRDARYAGPIEAVVGTNTLRTFVTQCDADYHVFTREINDGLQLRVSVVSSAGLRVPSELHPTHSRETLAELGFGGYAVDFLEAPRAILAVLCSRAKIHEVPLALGSVDHSACEQRLGLREYIADGARYTLMRGRYGSHASTVTTSRIPMQSRLLGGGGESDEVRATRERLGSEIDKLRDTQTSNEAQMKRIANRDRTLRDAHRQIEAQEAELREARRTRADAVQRWERQLVHVRTKRAQLQSLSADTHRGSADEVAETKHRIEQGMHENAKDRAKCLVVAATNATATVTALHALARGGLAGFRDTRALAEHRAAMMRLREAVAEAQTELERATDAFNMAKAAARNALEATRAATEDLTEEEREAVRNEQERRSGSSLGTSDELETELTTCRQRLSMAASSGVSSAVIAQFAERQKRLAGMVAQVQQLEAELLRVRRRKRHARDQWEQPLVDVVARISEKFRAMFDHIDCLGEVSLRKAGDGVTTDESSLDDEDYDNWGIEIRVAFRKNEALQALDNHRQSGGERAVSTILYLQALQSLVAAPFRVVDEINQGMDERNERLVHSLIVDSACQQGSSQYFLITPKLLPDLDYHPLMKVLCIFNGEWQPESFNFGKYISNARRNA